MASRNREEDRDIEIVIRFPTYGTLEQRTKTAATIKQILEVKLQRSVDVAMKVGNEWQDVERQDRNASVE